jgi:hypothetical protein
MRSLVFEETAFGLPTGVSSQTANLATILFPANARVKENREILLCKTSGGDPTTMIAAAM